MYFLAAKCGLESKRLKQSKNFIILNQSQEISSPKSMNNQGRDVTGGIQPKFVYQSTSLDYYEPVEEWEMDENTNVDVCEEIEEN